MIAVAVFLVWQAGRDNLPKAYRHVWMTEGWEYAIVELVEQQKTIEQEEHWYMHCLKWWIEERADIGY